MSVPTVPSPDTGGPGWHPDPTGRFDLRYHNGAHWTADVSSDGARFVDPLGSDSDASNRAASAAMVVGIVGAATGWIPFVAVASLVACLVAIALGIVGLRRARRTGGSGRGPAIAGVATGGGGLLVAALGVVLTVVVVDELDQYYDPSPNRATITSCTTDADGSAAATGELTNLGSSDADFTVRVAFVRSGTDNVQRSTRVTVDDVAPGATVDFRADAAVGVDVECTIDRVDGPLPFGIDFG